ncbi:MAG: hypothetical protein ACKO34_00990 [Vampirovibrionales bacterium]
MRLISASSCVWLGGILLVVACVLSGCQSSPFANSSLGAFAPYQQLMTQLPLPTALQNLHVQPLPRKLNTLLAPVQPYVLTASATGVVVEASVRVPQHNEPQPLWWIPVQANVIAPSGQLKATTCGSLSCWLLQSSVSTPPLWVKEQTMAGQTGWFVSSTPHALGALQTAKPLSASLLRPLLPQLKQWNKATLPPVAMGLHAYTSASLVAPLEPATHLPVVGSSIKQALQAWQKAAPWVVQASYTLPNSTTQTEVLSFPLPEVLSELTLPQKQHLFSGWRRASDASLQNETHVDPQWQAGSVAIQLQHVNRWLYWLINHPAAMKPWQRELQLSRPALAVLGLSLEKDVLGLFQGRTWLTLAPVSSTPTIKKAASTNPLEGIAQQVLNTANQTVKTVQALAGVSSLQGVHLLTEASPDKQRTLTTLFKALQGDNFLVNVGTAQSFKKHPWAMPQTTANGETAWQLNIPNGVLPVGVPQKLMVHWNHQLVGVEPVASFQPLPAVENVTTPPTDADALLTLEAQSKRFPFPTALQSSLTSSTAGWLDMASLSLNPDTDTASLRLVHRLK